VVRHYGQACGDGETIRIMMSGLEGKVAVVTGGAGGLRAASALRLSREGCRVVVVDIDYGGARKVAESLPGESIAVESVDVP
jgi:NAD(P)-dependent dehydrogenase (short-subunit alcohol dehydrogenase family)